MFVVSQEDCDNLRPTKTFDTQLCAGVQGGYKGYCSYDSGGPLTLSDGTLIGITSDVLRSCTNKPYPGIFTKVSKYIDWIEAKTGLKFD